MSMITIRSGIELSDISKRFMAKLHGLNRFVEVVRNPFGADGYTFLDVDDRISVVVDIGANESYHGYGRNVKAAIRDAETQYDAAQNRRVTLFKFTPNPSPTEDDK